uniref:F5/8 type C domain-containing protein n=1 Tax=Magallana gigas TaxID=29159 RepID=A0A8W8P256_MAGGI
MNSFYSITFRKSSFFTCTAQYPTRECETKSPSQGSKSRADSPPRHVARLLAVSLFDWDVILKMFKSPSFCGVNLSRKPTTTVTQSSTYTGTIFHNASLATDGTNKTTERFCSHTDVNHTKAWFQVDLGGKYSIKSVKIFYRREGDRESDWKQYRFRQFYLEVSQAPANTTAQRIRCYKDNTNASALPKNIIDIPCVQTARYVIVETTYEATEDDEYNVYGAILEICEIEVYGKWLPDSNLVL